MNIARGIAFSNNLFKLSTLAKLAGVFALAVLLSLYFQNIGALIAMAVLTTGVFAGNLYESRIENRSMSETNM